MGIGQAEGALAGGIGLVGQAALTGVAVRAAEGMIPKKRKARKKARA